MSAGKYIQRLLKEKNISLTQLSKSLNLKSRNTLYRLFSGYNSYQTEKDLINKIVGFVDFTESETSIIYKLLEKGKEGKYAYKSVETLLNIYRSDAGGFKVGNKKLTSVLSKHISGERGRVIIIASGIINANIIFDIYKILKEYRGKVRVYHYLHFPYKDELTICEVLALIRLTEFESYIPLKADNAGRNVPPEICILSKNSAGCHMQKVEFINEKTMLLETDIPEKLYRYEIKRNDNIRSGCIPLKFPVEKVTDYIKILSDVKELDENNGFFSEGAPCFGYLTADILCEMFKDINYFGFPEDHPYVIDLINIVKEKEGMRYKAGSRKRMLFDVSVLTEMMKTGISVDHAKEFLPMTREQCRRYFKFIVSLAKTRPDVFQIKILKDISVSCTYVYVEDRMLYIYRSKTGYTNGSSVIVKDSGVIEVMNTFTEYIWENYTLNEKESLEVLERLIEENLCEDENTSEEEVI